MQLDPNKLKALADVDDNRFSAMLFAAATAVGLPPEQARAAAANAPAFKKMLKNASQDDLATLGRKLQGSPSELLRQLGEKKHE